MTSPTAEHTCAVWYWRYFNMYYELFQSEREAARFAVDLENDGEGDVSGVQFSDGRAVARNEWELFLQIDKEEDIRIMREIQQRLKAPSPPKRAIRDPFNNREIKIKITEPEWLGR